MFTTVAIQMFGFGLLVLIVITSGLLLISKILNLLRKSSYPDVPEEMGVLSDESLKASIAALKEEDKKYFFSEGRRLGLLPNTCACCGKQLPEGLDFCGDCRAA